MAKAFKEVGLVERYGSGIRRIIDICKNYGLPEPYFENMETGFKVVLFGKIDNTENPTENLTQLEKKIIDALIKNPSYTQKQLAEEVSVGYTTVREYIVKLRNKGVITRVGSARSGYWKVK